MIFNVGDIVQINELASNSCPDNVGDKGIIVEIGNSSYPYKLAFINQYPSSVDISLKEEEMSLLLNVDELKNYDMDLNRAYTIGSTVKINTEKLHYIDEQYKTILGYTEDGYVILFEDVPNKEVFPFEIFENEIKQRVGQVYIPYAENANWATGGFVSDEAIANLHKDNVISYGINTDFEMLHKNEQILTEEETKKILSGLKIDHEGLTITPSNTTSSKKGKLFCFMGASGSGKSTIQHSLSMPFLTNYTTRELRRKDGEIDGIHINQVTHNQFEELMSEGKLLEWTMYANEYYGTPSWIVDELEKGKSYHSTKDINGVKKLREKLGEENVVAIYIEAPSIVDIIQRMINRGDNEEQIGRRVKQLIETDELENVEYADYVIKNDNLDEAILEAHRVIVHELCK